MRFPDLLATKRGRLTAFFFLYMTEGIPLGFTATAIATQMRRDGVGPAAVGAFVGSLYLPWALKFIFGPFVDVLSWDRFGRRRMWIVMMQSGMILTLLAAMPVNFSSQIWLFTILILVHNAFGATQDVAIDALAVGTLKESERGLANGLMFAGANLGQAVGGAGVLFLTSLVSFKATFLFVIACIASIGLLVALPLREPKSGRPKVEGSPIKAAGKEIKTFVRDAYVAFIGTRAAFVGVLFAILPAGPMALGLALQSNLAVELGLNDNQVGLLSLWSTVISAAGCVIGGLLSDRFGRKKMLAFYILGMAPTTLYLMTVLQRHQWIMPVDPNANDRLIVPALVTALWIATLVYALFNGLMYGTRTALFMDVTTPAVAATQFTAYMALLNLSISYSATWQGVAIEAIGYPRTLLIDSIFGIVSIALLPLMTRSVLKLRTEEASGAAAARARMMAAFLGLVMVAWIVGLVTPAESVLTGLLPGLRALAPLMGLFFTITFVITGVFLIGSVAVIAHSSLARVSMVAGILTLLVYVFRFYSGGIASLLHLDPAGPWAVFSRTYLVVVPAMAAGVLGAIVARWARLLVSIPEPAPGSDAPIYEEIPAP
jgi:MFS family permease